MRLHLFLANLLSLLLSAITSNCVPPLPNQLHVLSRLGFENEALRSTDYIKIDEYLNSEARQSSISIYNVRDDSTEIYYKKFSSDELANQMTIKYKPLEMKCEQQQIGHLQISELRRVALSLYESKEIPGKFVDVPIGPSLLLFAIQASMKQFRYSTTFGGRSPGAPKVNVFRRYIASSKLLVVLYVSSKWQRRGLKQTDTLDSALFEGAKLDVKYVGAYHVLRKQQAASNSTAPHETSSGQDEHEEEKVFDSISDGQYNRQLLFAVHFDIVEPYRAGSLMGRELDELERQSFEFWREPFLQPVGIGCWSLGVNLKWRDSLIVESKSSQGMSLSASFVTSAGLKGVSYVAYDGSSNMLRIDREGRKNIYDIEQGKSYHVSEFSDSSGLSDSMLANELATEKCIVLEMSNSIKQDKSVMVQLLGLGSSEAHYLGPRTIEHEQYKVYELSFNEPEAMPVLLQAKLDKVKMEFDLTYFITYYVQPDRRLRFIELYSYEAPLKQRKLINRLEFIEFSWSLDVEPLDDAQSGANSDSSLRLFQMDVCQHNRATQSSLVVELNSDDKQISAGDQLGRDLQYHKLELAGAIQRQLATSLRVSLMNLVDLRVNLDSFARDGRLLASGRVVDLKAGISQLNNLGATYLIDDGATLEIYPDRFSLEDCLLDSLEYPEANRFAYCPQLAQCLILPNDYKNSELLAESLSMRRDMCHVFLLKYSTTETSAGRASYIAEINQRSLDSKQFEFEVGAYDSYDNEQSPFTFKATMELRDLVRLDAIGAQLLSGGGSGSDAGHKLELLSGLRYTTMDEDEASHNSNQRVVISSKLLGGKDKWELFAHCQLSCQLDEFCGSFSFCLRVKNSSSNNNNNNVSSKQPTSPVECTLSTLRLTGERVEQLLEAASQSREGQSGGLQLNVSSEFASQVFKLHRDDACSLHPRDFVSDYQLTRSVETVNRKPGEQSETLQSVRVLPEMTFADCAGLSFERTFGVDFVGQTNFTYCQLDSLCLVRGDETSERQQELADGPCRSYQRDAIKFYTSLRATHMRVADVRQTMSSDDSLVMDITTNATTTTASLERADGPARLVTTFWGVSEADCARDCSLHKSQCLAFDSCRNEGKILCILYALRSPLSPRAARLPLLEREQKLAPDSVSLFGSRICDHFHLKPLYFKVRLYNQLAREEAGGEFLPDELRELEDKVEAPSERLNREDLLAVSDLGTIVDNYERAKQQQQRDSEPGGERLAAGLRGFELTIGLIAGCLLIAYKQQVSELIFSAYARVRA